MEYFEYPHWMMVAGAALLVVGLFGLALRRSSQSRQAKDR
jgi:hypothetical protein